MQKANNLFSRVVEREAHHEADHWQRSLVLGESVCWAKLASRMFIQANSRCLDSRTIFEKEASHLADNTGLWLLVGQLACSSYFVRSPKCEAACLPKRDRQRFLSGVEPHSA